MEKTVEKTVERPVERPAVRLWKPLVDGADIVVRDCIASWFGDTDDTQDNGIGWRGFPVRKYSWLPGCALAMRSDAIPALRNSPLPMLPEGTPVTVMSLTTGNVVVCYLVDLGPSIPNRPIDLSVGALHALGLDKTDGLYRVSFRIKGAAQK
jgi:hypothetical protein